MNTLFDEVALPEKPHTRNSDPITSHEAAASVRNITITHNHILKLLRTYGPMTDEQLFSLYMAEAENGGWKWVSVSGLRTRRSELVDAGHVADSGSKGKTRAGRSCIVWKAV